MKNLIILLSISSFLILSSCFAESEKPLSPIEDAVIDSTLIGMWTGDEDGYIYFNVIHNNLMQMTIISPDTSGTDFQNFVVFPTFSNGHSYLNYRLIELDTSTGDIDTSDYAFMHYKVKRNRLQIDIIMGLDDAVKSGRLKGIILPGNPEAEFDFSSSVVTDNSAEILKVVDSIVLYEEQEDWMNLKRCR